MLEFFNHRILFIVQGCEHCKIYKDIVWRFNAKVQVEKQIKIIDCTNMYSFKVKDHPLIKKYKKVVDNNYPTLIFEGIKFVGASLHSEVEAILQTLMNIDFVIKETDEYAFNKKCVYKKNKFLGSVVHCD